MSEDAAMPGVDNSLQHLDQLWSQRAFQRRTNGNPDFSRALTLLHALSNLLAATEAEVRVPGQSLNLKLPYMETLAQFMVGCKAGEGGSDDHATTKAIGAAKTTTAIHQTTEAPQQ